MMRDWALLILALVTFLGYYALPLGERAWMYYVTTGVLMLTLAACLRPFIRSRAGSFALAIVVIEAALHSVCGAARWGTSTTGTDMCKEWLGPDLYLAIGSVAVAAAVTWGARWHKQT